MFPSSPSESNSPRSEAAPILFAFVAGAGIAAALLWLLRSLQPRTSAFPQVVNPPIFESPTLPLPPPKELTADTVEEFLQWVAAVPISATQQIRDAVALARSDDAAHTEVIDSLFTLPVADFGRHQLLLSVLGELRRPDSAEHLIRFVNLPGEQIIPTPPRQQPRGLCTSYLDYCAGLQARAVEMLAHLRTQEALDAVLRVANAHPSRPVRLAALDAYLFAHEDSPDAAERARASARPEETMLVGLPRRSANTDPTEFDARLAEFYRRYPSEVPPRPHLSRCVRPAPTKPAPVSRPSHERVSDRRS